MTRHHFSILRKYAAQWGIPFTSVEPDYLGAPRELDVGPTRIMSILDWSDSPKILIERGASKLAWPHLLHEIAHAICPRRPRACAELEDTTGIELLSLFWLGLPLADWNGWQADYEADEEIGCVYADQWRNAPPSWRAAKMRAACDEARLRGHFVDGEPTFSLYRLVDGAPTALFAGVGASR